MKWCTAGVVSVQRIEDYKLSTRNVSLNGFFYRAAENHATSNDVLIKKPLIFFLVGEILLS